MRLSVKYTVQKLILLLLLFFSFSLFAQNGPVNPLSSRSNGVANASVAFNDINSLFNNQAGLADLKYSSFLFSGQETFVAPNSDNLGAGFALPISSGTIGFNFEYFGDSRIEQTKIGLAYARKLLETLSVGIQFDMISTQLPLNEKSNLFTVEIGVQYELSENLVLGIHLFNPAKLEIIEDEYLPTVLRVGATYSPNEKLLVHAEIEKDVDFSVVFKSGLEYELVHHLWLRIGFQHKPTTVNAGVGYLFKNGLRIDLAAYYQPGLDLTSSGRIKYSAMVPTVGVGFDIFKNKVL